MIGLVTDSNAQLPAELARRYDVQVVPLTVTIDGQAFLEGVDLDADGFYDRFAGGHRPEVSTAQPSPGHFAEAYDAAARRGATEILSIHIGSAISGTVDSARLAAASSPVPVQVVDTGTASFGVACCVWEAGEALAGGASPARAAAVARRVGATVGTVFVVGALELAEAGGRLAPEVAGAGPAGGAIPVLTMAGGRMRAVAHVGDLDAAADAMAARVLATGDSAIRVGLGIADAGATPLRKALEARLAGAPQIGEVVHYRIGPSVGAHTGPGTVGAFYYRSPERP